MRKILLLVLALGAFALSAQATTGDVNSDGEVNISDVNALIDQILSGSTTTAGDVNSDGEVNISDVNALIDIILGGSVPLPPITPNEIALDFSDLTEPFESVPDDEDAADYGDYVENTTWATTVRITFDGDTAIVTGNPSSVIPTVKGAHVTITSAAKHVRYNVSGSTADGSLKFYSERKFQLRLDSVDITNPHGAAINNQCGKSLYVEVVSGTTNTLTDGTSYTEQTYQQKGALFSEGQIYFSGSGTLNVVGSTQNAIACDDYIVVDEASITATSSTGHGIKVNDGFWMNSGTLTVDVTGDGCKGISNDSITVISGGTMAITTSGDCVYDAEAADYSSAACIKSDYQFKMTGGMVTLVSSGDGGKGINCDEDVVFSGGLFKVSVNKSWACDNGTDSDSPADHVTVVGTPTSSTIEKKSVEIIF